MRRKSIFVAAVMLGAAALVPATASAKSGGHGMGNHGGGMNTARQQAHVERPAFKFKLIRCHKYARGNGMGSVNWVSVCS